MQTKTTSLQSSMFERVRERTTFPSSKWRKGGSQAIRSGMRCAKGRVSGSLNPRAGSSGFPWPPARMLVSLPRSSVRNTKDTASAASSWNVPKHFSSSAIHPSGWKPMAHHGLQASMRISDGRARKPWRTELCVSRSIVQRRVAERKLSCTVSRCIVDVRMGGWRTDDLPLRKLSASPRLACRQRVSTRWVASAVGTVSVTR